MKMLIYDPVTSHLHQTEVGTKIYKDVHFAYLTNR